jgi:hypothetical protein
VNINLGDFWFELFTRLEFQLKPLLQHWFKRAKASKENGFASLHAALPQQKRPEDENLPTSYLQMSISPHFYRPDTSHYMKKMVCGSGIDKVNVSFSPRRIFACLLKSERERWPSSRIICNGSDELTCPENKTRLRKELPVARKIFHIGSRMDS